MRLPRYSLYLRLLGASLIVGAFFDFALAFLFAAAPELASAALALPLPGETFYLWILAVLLAMVGCFYLLAAYDPIAYSGNVLVAVAGRTAAGGALALAAVERPDLAGLYPLAAIELLFAAVHTLCWWPIRRR